MALWRSTVINFAKLLPNPLENLSSRLPLTLSGKNFCSKPERLPHSVAYEGGDLNDVSLMGCVSKVKILESAATGRPYARLSVATASVAPSGTEHRLTHWVYVFNHYLVDRCNRLKRGERIYISGFLSNFYLNSAEAPKGRVLIGNVIANKVITMGPHPRANEPNFLYEYDADQPEDLPTDEATDESDNPES